MSQFHENPALGRFEIAEPGGTVFANFRREGTQLFIDHVETPMAMRGQGAAGRLMGAIFEMAQKQGLNLVPICPYAVAWLRRRNERTGPQGPPSALSSG